MTNIIKYLITIIVWMLKLVSLVHTTHVKVVNNYIQVIMHVNYILQSNFKDKVRIFTFVYIRLPPVLCV